MSSRARGAVSAVLFLMTGFQQDAWSQSPSDWPNKSIRIIVNFGPGGSADNSVRPMTESLSKLLGQQVVIENRGGASGALGLEAMVKSPADGYTFAVTPALSVIILPHLRSLPYDPLKDLAPVTRITDGTLLFAVHPSVPANNMAEFVAYAKQNPNKLSWGTAGVGSYGHIMAEVFKLEAGVNILHVPYRGGGESLVDFLSGVVQVHADPNTMPHATSGKVKLFAVLDRQRLAEMPNVPTLKEIYPAMDFLAWFGMYAPSGTPPEVVKRMANAVKTALADPELKVTLRKSALSPSPSTPEELGEQSAREHERFGKLIRSLNIRAE